MIKIVLILSAMFFLIVAGIFAGRYNTLVPEFAGEVSTKEDSHWACRVRAGKMQCIPLESFLKSFVEDSTHTETL